ncbi:hypothetical protein HDU83_005298 [Entophlyctis luteolus]|nr:hypothetical protein HDU83_005298 [Entophlyctis luteolus]
MIKKTVLLAACASSLWARVHEQIPAIPSGWTTVELPAEPNQVLLTVALKLQNVNALDSLLAAVSTPGNKSYGQYVDVDAANALFSPSSETVAAVQSWLAAAGSTAVTNDGQFVHVQTTVTAANSLLNTTFLNYKSPSGVVKLRTTQYSVPDSISDLVDFVHPTVFFSDGPEARAQLEQTQVDVESVTLDCGKYYTPSCAKKIYNVGNYSADAKSGSWIGFASFLNESAIYDDLSTFENYYGIPPQNFTVVSVDSGVNDQDIATANYIEANLDVENIIGQAHPLPVREYITAGSPPFIPNLDEPTAADNSNEPYLPYFAFLLSQPNSAIPQVISHSYGDDEQIVPFYYAQRVCNMIGIMGLRGISIIFSSGDSGVGGPCKSNDGKNTTQFTPTFPATCPYVTAVGGTVYNSTSDVEGAWAGSSGGFSNYFSRPFYQELAVKKYLSSEISHSTKKYYSKYTDFSGRGFPDVAAQSVR